MDGSGDLSGVESGLKGLKVSSSNGRECLLLFAAV